MTSSLDLTNGDLPPLDLSPYFRKVEQAPGGIWRGRVAELMYASHASLRDDFQVSCAELDLLVGLARGAGDGVIGSRLTGGGFGGCTISLVRREALDGVVRHVREGYLRQAGREATVFVTRPVDGARAIKAPHPEA